jgi:integrase
MEFAVAEGLIDRNFAENLHRGLPQHLSYPPHPFTMPELHAIFRHPPLYDRPPPLELRGGMFWLPLIGLFTGMRLAETAQLWTRDIAIVENIAIIRVLPYPPGEDPREDKRVKTKNSMRVIPIHPELERAGFVEFWRAAQSQGRKRLFPEFLREGPSHGFGQASRELTRFVRSATGGNERVSYKSFRHTFRDAARDADLPRERARLLGGWGAKDSSDRYGIGGSVPRLYRDINQICYAGLDLTHLAIRTG